MHRVLGLVFMSWLAACADSVARSDTADVGASDADVGASDADVVVPDPAPPRPIAPLSTATVTSQRPTFRWALAPGTDGATIDLCRTRACVGSDLVQTIHATGTSGTASRDLAPGVWFWRLHGRAAATVGTRTSATWEFTVGHRSAPVDASWGTTIDVNGDGYADAVVGEPDAERAYVYLGGAASLSSTPATTLLGPDGGYGGQFGVSVASAGDVNGDGFADLVVGASYEASSGRAYVYLGGAAGLSSTPAATLTNPDGPGAYFGFSVASAGDVNGDGYTDLVVGAHLAASSGRTYVYLGGAAGLSSTPAATLTGPDGAHGGFGFSVASAGDVDGDGYADLVVGAPYVASNVGRAYLYLGGAAGLGSTPAATLTGPDGAIGYFGFSVASAGDVNGDGFADLVVSEPNAARGAGRTYVYLGTAAGRSSAPATTLTGPDELNGDFGGSVASAGDVNGDGYADLVVGARGAASDAGRTYVYLGGATGLGSTPAAMLSGPDGARGEFGGSVASPGDVNGDGFADLVVGAPSALPSGRAYVYLGAAAGLSSAPATTLISTDGVGGDFGSSVASAGEVHGDRIATPNHVAEKFRRVGAS